MREHLTSGDIEFILESLNYTQLQFESTRYPTYEFKQSQLKRVEAVMAKLRALQNEMSDSHT